VQKKNSTINVQLTLWDIEVTQKTRLITETEEEVTENKDLLTISPKKITPIENEKTEKPLKLTDSHQKFLDKNKIYENVNLSRVIIYCSGGLGIELQEKTEFKTIYVNAEGNEEFTKNKKLPVLPMDKIIYYKNEVRANEIQEKKLLNLKQKFKDSKEIRRRGDENILVELSDKIISINSIGWVLEFQGVKAIYSENEVVQAEIIDIKDILSKVKVGDIIEVAYPDRTFNAKVTHMYGGYNESLCISYEVDGDQKSTAIPRVFVKSILKCA